MYIDIPYNIINTKKKKEFLQDGSLVIKDVPIVRSGPHEYLANEIDVDDEGYNPNDILIIDKPREDILELINYVDNLPLTLDHPSKMWTKGILVNLRLGILKMQNLKNMGIQYLSLPISLLKMMKQ